MPALHLIDSLVNGTEHPFWRYSMAVQSSIKHRRPPGEVETLRRAMAVGLLRAMMRAMGPRSESRAGVKIETACMKRGMKITARQLNEWNTEFLTTSGDDPEPERIAEKFSTVDGKPIKDQDRILANGIHNLDEFFGKPNW